MARDSDALKDELLVSTLPHVLFDGWTDRALAAGAESMGIDMARARRMFPQGTIDLVGHFSDWADRRMVAELEARGEEFQALKVREKITLAVRTRLELLEPHKEALRRAAAILAMPIHVGLASAIVYRTVDAMWRVAGDQSADFNFYTKRGLLAVVQTSTTLYWLADQSDDHEATWEFLDRRIADVLAFGRRFGGLARLGQAFEGPFRFAAVVRDRFGRAGQ